MVKSLLTKSQRQKLAVEFGEKIKSGKKMSKELLSELQRMVPSAEDEKIANEMVDSAVRNLNRSVMESEKRNKKV